MSEFAGVDPHRVRLLADRLRDLADTLDREGPNIKQRFSSWQGTINQAVLSQQTTQVRADARDMARRADEALNLLHGTRLVDPNDPHKDWISIPWDVSKINATQEAQEEARNLKWAMDNPKEPSARAIISETSQSLADHQDDPAYLQAFMAAGGMDQATRAADILHKQDGTHDGVVLNKDSEAILARFGQGVQAATSLAAQGRIQLPPGALAKLTKPADSDMWSVGMLFKYGPSGDKWDPKVLSDVGGAMLDFRATHEMRPAYEGPGSYNPIGGTYVGDRHAWYTSLGLGVDYRDGGSMTDHAYNIQGIDANDPSIALMQRVSENPDASRLILTGPDGANHAKTLVSYKWHTPGSSFDDAKFPAAVITAATMDRVGHPKESTEAASNIVNAGAAEYDLEQARKDLEKDNYGTPTGITRALSQVFSAYVPDFAYSTDGKNGDGAYVIQPGQDGTYLLHASRDTMKNFFSEIMQNHDDGSNVVNAINAQVAMTFARGSDNPQAKAFLSNLAELRGEVSVAGQKVKYDPAAKTDADHINEIKWLNVVGGFVASVPTNNIPADFVKAAIWGGLPIASAAFSTNNASTVDSNAQVTVFDDYAQMRVSIVQGLVGSNKIEPPKNHPEWASGNITFRPGTNDQQEFEGWWTGIAQSHPEIENLYKTDMGNGFDLGAGRFNSN
ncbi:hypothetical protein [Streptomyces sp. SPB162]|uniref:hypothetical protein n=1 Tax=Streptomyces sp. SPB162 TaxID=2940560 RepID=UPI002404DEA6|nr:hypothetical protein [Streptomyces sp. SPB162]MDF9815148.1 hypothetical protein [Streptomyces sp. SPB162]